MTSDPLGELKRTTAMMGMSGALQVMTAVSMASQDHHAKCPVCTSGKRCQELETLLDHARQVLIQATTNYRAQFVDEAHQPGFNAPPSIQSTKSWRCDSMNNVATNSETLDSVPQLAQERDC